MKGLVALVSDATRGANDALGAGLDAVVGCVAVDSFFAFVACGAEPIVRRTAELALTASFPSSLFFFTSRVFASQVPWVQRFPYSRSARLQ